MSDKELDTQAEEPVEQVEMVRVAGCDKPLPPSPMAQANAKKNPPKPAAAADDTKTEG